MSRVSSIFIILGFALIVTEISAKAKFQCDKPDWKEYSIADGLKCFFYGDREVATFTEARDFCKSKNAKLVSIHSAAENEFLRKERPFGISHYWIGYTEKNGKQYWNNEDEITAGEYVNFKGISTCIMMCEHAVVSGGGDWSKVQEKYIHKAKPLCQKSEKEHGSFAPEATPVSCALIVVTTFMSRFVF